MIGAVSSVSDFTLSAVQVESIKERYSDRRFTSRDIGKMAGSVSGWIGGRDSDSEEGIALQWLYSVAGVNKTATSHLSSSTVSLSPHHLIASHH